VDDCYNGKGNKYYIFVCVCAQSCVGVCMRLSVCSVAYLAYNSFAPYCDVICGLPGSTTIFDITSFLRKVIERKTCFDFLYKFCLKYFSFYKEFARYCLKCRNVFMKSTRYSCRILIFSTGFRKKKLKYQISSKSVQWEPSRSMRTDAKTKRQTDGRTWRSW
jgi:hypothetical protein